MRLIRYVLALLPLMLLLVITTSSRGSKRAIAPTTDFTTSLNTATTDNALAHATELYSAWHLAESGLSQDAFEKAVTGYNTLEAKRMLNNDRLLTIIDYSKPSSQKRLYVLDMTSGEIVFNTLVAHGRNSGLDYASDFSNVNSSLKTSLGFYITMGTYMGGNGYSMKLMGCEKGINDNAYTRAIVFHGADYVSNDFLRNNGYLGRSYGCPAVSIADNRKIIEKIKNGSCMFLYHPTKKYTERSRLLNS